MTNKDLNFNPKEVKFYDLHLFRVDLQKNAFLFTTEEGKEANLKRYGELDAPKYMPEVAVVNFNETFDNGGAEVWVRTEVVQNSTWGAKSVNIVWEKRTPTLMDLGDVARSALELFSKYNYREVLNG